MTSSSAGTHEPVAELHAGTREMHRAIVSLMEELEAVDWYQQRIDASRDEALAAVLQHNRDEEVEHAVMVLEWLRRRDPVFDRHLRTYLFTQGDILAVEAAAEVGDGQDDGPDHGAGDRGRRDGGGTPTAPPPRTDPHLAIGSLREAA